MTARPRQGDWFGAALVFEGQMGDEPMARRARAILAAAEQSPIGHDPGAVT